MLWDPLHYLEACPSSDGAAAMVLGTEQAAAEAQAATGRRPAWVHGMAMRSEPTMFAGRDQINPRAGRECAPTSTARPAITDPRREFDCAEVYVPFSWYEPMWLENLGFCDEGEGWKLTEAGATSMDGGDIPWNCSGGVLSSNPIGASGMLRFLEVALQVRGEAGDHQVDGVRRALGQAYGGGSQFFAMWVLSAPKVPDRSPGGAWPAGKLPCAPRPGCPWSEEVAREGRRGLRRVRQQRGVHGHPARGLRGA